MLNQKGGVGKTTSTANLGAALADSGCRVLLIDLDPQGHLTLHLGLAPGPDDPTAYDLLLDPQCQARDTIMKARDRLDAIFSEVDLAIAESELPAVQDRQRILQRKTESIRDQYDVIIIDCPPSLGQLTLNALAMADEVIVPMQAHFLALQGVGRLLETVELITQSVNAQLRVTGILLCMYESQTTLAREVVTDINEYFEAVRDQAVPWNQCHVLQPPIRRNIKLAEAPSFGQTIFDYAPQCNGARDYRAVADQLLKAWGGPPPQIPVTDSDGVTTQSGQHLKMGAATTLDTGADA